MKTKLTKRVEATDRLRTTLERLQRELKSAQEAEKHHLTKKRGTGKQLPKNIAEAILLAGENEDHFASQIRRIENRIRHTEREIAHLDELNHLEKRKRSWNPN